MLTIEACQALEHLTVRSDTLTALDLSQCGGRLTELVVVCPFLEGLSLKGCARLTDDALSALSPNSFPFLSRLAVNGCRALTTGPLF